MIIRDLKDFPAALRGGVACIGNFDGVHVGHAKMIETSREIARPHGWPVVAMTFDPHPSTLIFPNVPRPMLTTLEQRVELLLAAGADGVVIQHVTPEYLKISPESFMTETLQGTMGVRHLVEGMTFTFGYKAKGNVQMLMEKGPSLGFETTIVPIVERTLADMQCVSVSSTLTRFLVSHGRMNDVAVCLGRPFTLRGEVVRGFQRGRQIGFPTANVATGQILPAAGVYAGAAVLPRGERYAAAISVGTNPTFAGDKVTVEAYLLDFDGDLYGKILDVEFHRWLRDQETYSGIEPLIRQLKKDVDATRVSMAALVNA